MDATNAPIDPGAGQVVEAGTAFSGADGLGPQPWMPALIHHQEPQTEIDRRDSSRRDRVA